LQSDYLKDKGEKITYKINNKNSQEQWLISIILATQEAEIGRIMV
jgi:hypothetical protein